MTRWASVSLVPLRTVACCCCATNHYRRTQAYARQSLFADLNLTLESMLCCVQAVWLSNYMCGFEKHAFLHETLAFKSCHFAMFNETKTCKHILFLHGFPKAFEMASIPGSMFCMFFLQSFIGNVSQCMKSEAAVKEAIYHVPGFVATGHDVCVPFQSIQT